MSTSKLLLLRFAKPYPGWIILTIVLGFSGALFNGVGTTLIVPVILKIVGQPVDLTGAPHILKAVIFPFDNLPANYRIVVMAVAIILTIFFKNLASYSSTLASSILTRKLTADIRESGVNLLLEIDIDYYSKMKVGDLINRLGGETARAATAIGSAVKLVILAITILVFVGLLLSISWQLTIATTILLSCLTFINQYAISRARDFGKQLSDFSTSYSITVLETLSGIRLVKATGNEDREYQKIRKLIRDREVADFKAQVHSEAIGPISEVTGITTLMLIVFLARTFFAVQVSSLSTVILTYILVLLRLLPFISQFNSLRSNYANASASVDIISEFLEVDNKPFMVKGKLPYKKLAQGVHFNQISFAYPGNEKLVLKDVNLYLPRGTTLALVGGSGAGKSTLADLLPRFYDPIAGSINIDGTDLREFELKSLRKAMGIVSQDTFLFNDSVRNNIAYGKPDATEEEVLTAAKRANAHEFISKLPQGVDTLIGDRGVMLSGGQRQRIAIARALLQNPEILILDEATSALDTVSERLVQAAIDDLSRDRTTLVIAHRLSTVQKADQIAVLEHGCVVEVGTHDELLKKGSYYSHLYSMQFTERAEAANKRNLSFIRISYELRTRLNSMIGFLSLLVDNTFDNSQDKYELIEEAYISVLRVLNTIDILEDVINLQLRTQLVSAAGINSTVITQYHKFTHMSLEFRNHLNPILGSLRCIADDFVDQPLHKNEFFKEALSSAIQLLEAIKMFEFTVRK
ncbi:MAG: ABC transporter ATP-binding protein [Gloeotrichia echinulata CP02]|jgi:subfamily B ATP-binding cassette protein MsbA|nr:ABC transporter ATP-binding protein/permease [Gloeotrichia echinulata DEX184]